VAVGTRANYRKMCSIGVSLVADVLTDLRFDKRRLNFNLGALSENYFEPLQTRFNSGMINHRDFVESILGRWIQNYGCGATIAALSEARAINGERQASGELAYKSLTCFSYVEVVNFI
jgi:hypothetical protein